MMSNNHKNSGCGYEAQLVSCLYGEASAQEIEAFESHSQTCLKCAAEFESFAGVQFSINDWKAKEFAALETPRIEIPYEKPTRENEPSGREVSWSAGLRDLFSLSPAKWLATASIAVLLVCVGIVWSALNDSKDDSIAGQNDTRSNAVIAPTVEKTPEVSRADSNQNKPSENEEQRVLAPKTSPSENVGSTESKNKKSLPKANVQRQPQKADATNRPKTIESKRDMKNNQQVAPKIVEDEDEDDTLRLAELFEEIGAVE
jgi:hypothetical protein